MRRYKYRAGDSCPMCNAPFTWIEVNGKWKLVCPQRDKHMSLISSRRKKENPNLLAKYTDEKPKEVTISQEEYNNLLDTISKDTALIKILQEKIRRLEQLIDNLS